MPAVVLLTKARLALAEQAVFCCSLGHGMPTMPQSAFLLVNISVGILDGLLVGSIGSLQILI